MDENRKDATGEIERAKGGVKAWLVVILLSAAMAVSLIDRFALSLLFQPIKSDLGISDTQLGLLHGVAFGLFYAALGVPIAWLVDKWSRKWVILIGVSVWSVMTALCGLSQTFLQLLGARIGVGAGEAALAPAGYSIISDLVDRKSLGAAISVFQMGSLMGAGLAFLLGGMLFSAISGWDYSMLPLVGELSPWQMTFIAVALPGIPLFLALLFVREPNKSRAVIPESEARKATTLVGELKRNAAKYSTLFLGNSCVIAVSYANMSWIPTVFGREFGWSVAETGLRIGVVLLVAAPTGTLLGGVLADRWSRRAVDAYGKVLLLAASITFVLLVIMATVKTAALVFGVFAAIQFSTSMVVGVGPAKIQLIAPADVRGRVSSIYVFLVNLIGLGLGPVTIGFLSDFGLTFRAGVLGALLVYCVVMIIIALSLLGMFHNIERRQILGAEET